MEKNNKHHLIILVLFFSILLFLPKPFANESKKFSSLKNNEVNLRQGPSFAYPIKFIYIKKYLPVEILDEFETFVIKIEMEFEIEGAVLDMIQPVLLK